MGETGLHQCPFCMTAVPPNAVVCAACGAYRSTQLAAYPGTLLGFAVLACLWYYIGVGPLLFTRQPLVVMPDHPWVTRLVAIIGAYILWRIFKSMRAVRWYRRR